MIYKSIPEIEQVFLGSSTAIGRIFNGSDLVFKKEEEDPYWGQYIIFSDPDVKSIIVNKYGDTTIGEITYGQAAAVTSFMSGAYEPNNPLFKNKSIDSFDEFTYFTSITSVGNFTCYECSNMTSITIPENVTSIGEYAFGDCSSLESVTIPSSVTSIGRSAFYECTNMTSINIPNGVTYINDTTFYSCSSLTSITIPENVTSILQKDEVQSHDLSG